MSAAAKPQTRTTESKTENTGDDWVSKIRGLVGRNDSSPSSGVKATIFQVPEEIRKQNNEAYNSVIITLGPFSKRNTGFEYKQFYLRHFLELINNDGGISPDRYVELMRGWTEECRSSYGVLPFQHEHNIKEAFTRLLTYNCCFVSEVIREYAKKKAAGKGTQVIIHSIYSVSHRLPDVLHDIMLFENQLPFFMLERVFEMIPADSRDGKNFESMVAKIVNDNFSDFGFIQAPTFGSTVEEKTHEPRYEHLLDFVHSNWCPNYCSNEDKETKNSIVVYAMKKILSAVKPTKEVNHISNGKMGTENSSHHSIEFLEPTEKILSATELKEKAAVHFKRGGDDQKFFDVRFENGTFRIPTFSTDNRTEHMLRNMIAYEQTALDYLDAGSGNRKRYVTHYMILMSWLINTTDDVKLLCEKGIINGMGMDHNAILRFFVAFGVHGYNFYPPHYFYSHVADKVSHHCNKNRNMIMATLKSSMKTLHRDIFYSPWAYISFFAAFALLVLTVLQTINSY